MALPEPWIHARVASGHDETTRLSSATALIDLNELKYNIKIGPLCRSR